MAQRERDSHVEEGVTSLQLSTSIAEPVNIRHAGRDFLNLNDYMALNGALCGVGLNVGVDSTSLRTKSVADL